MVQMRKRFRALTDHCTPKMLTVLSVNVGRNQARAPQQRTKEKGMASPIGGGHARRAVKLWF